MTPTEDLPDPTGPARPPAAADGALERALQRAREERDDALRHAIETEHERDLGQALALRFEREMEERQRTLARALHEELGRHATSLRMLAATLEKRLADREPSLAQLAGLMVRNADALAASVRTMVQQVQPEPLEHGGLPEGLRSLLADWRLRQPGIRFELLLEPAEDAAFGLGAARVEAAAWRIVAEAIENAVLHAGAGTVVVSVRRTGGTIPLQVSDDGHGLARRLIEGPGLRAMRERAAACGGSVTVANGESGGAEVLARLPWPDGGAQA